VLVFLLSDVRGSLAIALILYLLSEAYGMLFSYLIFNGLKSSYNSNE
jgi:hypothetical protein